MEKGFIESVQPLGKSEFVFLMYVAVPRSHTVTNNLDLSKWPNGSSIRHFSLEDESWPMLIELFEFVSPVFPPALDECISDALRDAVDKQDAQLAWFMFDGAFVDYYDLFLDWHKQQTYGVYLKGFSPKIAFSSEERSDSAWSNMLDEASKRLK